MGLKSTGLNLNNYSKKCIFNFILERNKMVTKKKAVKKVVVKKKVVNRVPERIENINLVTFFKTGEREHSGDVVYIHGNVLNCITNYPSRGDYTAAAVKVDGYTIINGDDVQDNIGDFEDVVDQLQDYGDKEITTSFLCLKNAGINFQKIKVLEITKDLDVSIRHGEEGFDEFEANVPQGATYKEYPDYDLDKDENIDGPEAKINKILEKRYHRAGCMLIREGKFSYICGMDEETYFVTKLSKNTTTINTAFQSLKPIAVQQWEKKNGTQAIRQGEWFFLPTDFAKVKGMRRKGLPLWKAGGNKHMAEKYVVQDGRNYVKGDVTHIDHEPTRLGDVIHEAIMNTQLGSWSEQGVD